MALAMLVTPVNITSVKADQIYNIEKSSQSQITKNKINQIISSQKADIRTGTVTIENKRLEAANIPGINYGTINQAAITLKKAMLVHQNTLYVFVKSKSSAADQIYYDIEDKALSVTDNPVEGDYMLWDISNRDVSYRAQKSNGYYLYQFLIKIKYFTTLEQRSLVDDKVNQIIEELGFTSETTDYEKVKAVYDYV
jgi:Cu/Ag efflux protein CusF